MKPILYYFRKHQLLSALFIHLLFPLATNAYTKSTKPNDPSASVTIVLQDINLAKDATIKFEMCRDEINTSLSRDLDGYEYKIIGPTTKFKIPLNSKTNYGTISFYSSFFQKPYGSPDDISTHKNLIKSLYIFETGDNILISIAAHKVTFSGKGSEKYTCINELNGQDHSEVYKMGDAIPLDIEKDKLIQAYFDKEYLFYQHKKNILTKYKNKLSIQIFLLIEADLWAEYNERLINALYSKSIPYKKRVNEWHNLVERAYSNLNKNFNEDKFNRDILAKSYNYCDFLYKRERFETILFTKTDAEYYNLRYTFQELFERIQKKHKGLIQDKLILLTSLTELKSRTDINAYLVTLVEEMGRNNFRIKMQQLVETVTGNAFPFALPDETGKIHELRDFKGKLLVIDFWFTGCSGCISLAKEMKPIIASYKSNPNVIFITICVDKDKKMWLKSLKEEKYGSSDELNLYTEGMAIDHPIIKHYNITGFPFLLIVSKGGKVLSTAPPRPFKNIDDSAETFIDFINQYL